MEKTCKLLDPLEYPLQPLHFCQSPTGQAPAIPKSLINHLPNCLSLTNVARGNRQLTRPLVRGEGTAPSFSLFTPLTAKENGGKLTRKPAACSNLNSDENGRLAVGSDESILISAGPQTFVDNGNTKHSAYSAKVLAATGNRPTQNQLPNRNQNSNDPSPEEEEEEAEAPNNPSPPRRKHKWKRTTQPNSSNEKIALPVQHTDERVPAQDQAYGGSQINHPTVEISAQEGDVLAQEGAVSAQEGAVSAHEGAVKAQERAVSAQEGAAGQQISFSIAAKIQSTPPTPAGEKQPLMVTNGNQEAATALAQRSNTVAASNRGSLLERVPTSNLSLRFVLPETSSTNEHPVDCIGRQRPPIGEKCFALLLVFLITGTLLTGFGTTCLVPVREGAQPLVYCKPIGGFTTALIVVCGGTVLALVGVVSCILINECSDRQLHGGKCHINCHIFEDLVE